MQPTYLNSLQPKRDIQDEQGNYLQFRTHISKPDSVYLVFDIHNIVAQIMLYRWANSDDFDYQVPISDLHDYLMYYLDEKWPKFSKNHMGRTMVQAVIYEPKKLKGVTKDNPKVIATYYIPNRLDLVYGLEWMLCAWLKKLGEGVEGFDMEEELSAITSESLDNVRGLFLEPIMDMELQNPKWRKTWEAWKLEPQRLRVQKETKPSTPPKLRSLS